MFRFVSAASRVRIVCSLLAAVSVCSADDGGDRPSYKATSMELVGHVRTGTVLADVWVHNAHVYLGSRACGEGVSIVDAADPAQPRVLGRLPADAHSTYEDVVVIRAETPHFRGDLLATGVQPCSRDGNQRGVHLWDVTDPANPVELAFFRTGQRGSVHELAARQVGERVYLYLAVPYSERYGEGGDFRIVDASNPREPVQVSDWGVYGRLQLNDNDLRVLGRPVVYCHSVSVSEDGQYAFLSYWDAGYIALDIRDPENPVFLSRTAYTMPEEGNAHSVFAVMSRSLLVAADEDYQIGGARVEITAPENSVLAASELPFAKPACSAEPVRAEVVFAGQGCGGALPASAAGRIAAFEAGGCSYYEKALAAQRAGAAGVFLTQTAERPQPGAEPIIIPGVILLPQDFVRLRNSRQIVRAQIGPGPDDTWGYIRIFDIADLTAPRQIGSFATENTKRCPPADGGWYSVHNPVVAGDIAYLSWYSDGIRAVDISDPTNPREIGSFVVTAHAHQEDERAQRQRGARHNDGDHVDRGSGAEPATFVWGVVVQDGLIYLSDEMTGLWIVRLNPETAGAVGRGREP